MVSVRMVSVPRPHGTLIRTSCAFRKLLFDAAVEGARIASHESVAGDALVPTVAQYRRFFDRQRAADRLRRDSQREVNVEEITPGELEKIRTDRLSAVKVSDAGKVQRVTPAIVNREFAFLKQVYNAAMRDGKTAVNPVAKLKMLREPSGRVRYLTDDEEKRLMEALEGDQDRQRGTVLLHTGLRKSECLGLRWRDVDFKAGVLTIPRSKNGEGRHVPMT